jgi:hypothetical protein
MRTSVRFRLAIRTDIDRWLCLLLTCQDGTPKNGANDPRLIGQFRR